MTAPAISIVIPNYNRSDQLRQTLIKLSELNELSKEIIVVDNHSEDGADVMVGREFPWVKLIRLDSNVAAAARNSGLERAKGPITLMLDNDSYPAEGTLKKILKAFQADRYLGVLACRIKLGSDRHEPGGLPGVFVGCGAAMRTDLVRKLGGYPKDFGYYVEEYDLACRVWQSGFRIRWCYDAVVHHAKSPVQRNMGRILYFLTRNNLRLWHCYCPPEKRRSMLRETASRYALIARVEHAVRGYLRGLTDGVYTIARNYRRRKELTLDQFDALFGAEALRKKIQKLVMGGTRRVHIFGWGKGLEQIVDATRQAGIDINGIIPHRSLPVGRLHGAPVFSPESCCSLDNPVLIGSLSPGGALDLEAQARIRWPDVKVVRLIEFA